MDSALRGFANGTPAAGDVIAALARCAGIDLVGYPWASSTCEKRA